jgi:hypothetical protein
MKKIPVYLLLCIVAFSTACPKYKPKQVDLNNQNSFTKRLNIYFEREQRRYINALDAGVAGADRARGIRNQFVEDVLPYIDEVYMDFITDLQAGRDRDNFVADLIELGTSAAVGITNGERPLQILGIALTAFRGGRRSADLNFYKEQTTPVLINKMDGNRAKVRATILSREKDDVMTYPIGAAISDIVDYYNAGTLVRAFTELQKDTATQTRAAENKVLELKGVTIAPEVTQETRDIRVTAGKTLKNLRDGLKNAGTQQASTTKLRNIVTALEEDDDLKTLLRDGGLAEDEADGAKLSRAILALRSKLTQEGNEDLLNRIDRVVLQEGQ